MPLFGKKVKRVKPQFVYSQVDEPFAGPPESIVVPDHVHENGDDTTPESLVDKLSSVSMGISKRISLEEVDGFPSMMTTQFSQFKDPNATRDYYNFYKSRIISDPFYHNERPEGVHVDEVVMVNGERVLKKYRENYEGVSPQAIVPSGFQFSTMRFSAHEQVLMREALACCVRCSFKAYEAANDLFEDNVEQFETWFGVYKRESIKRVVSGVYRMHRVLSNPEKILTFIDMRHQRERDSDRPRPRTSKPAPGTSTCYLASNQDMFTSKPAVDPFAPVAFGSPEHLPATGLRILVGEKMLQPWQSPLGRALIIYHEISHKILGTVDKGFVNLSQGKRPCSMEAVFGAEHTRKMVEAFPSFTLLHADCWAHFIASFGEED